MINHIFAVLILILAVQCERTPQTVTGLPVVERRKGSPPEEPMKIPNELLPFDQPVISELQKSEHKVVSHWFLWPISRDNKPADEDRYQDQLNTGEFYWDSSLRFRPLGRPSRSEDDWKLRDAMADIRLAQAMGIDGFLLNQSTCSSAEQYRDRLCVYIRAAEELNTGFMVSPNHDLYGGRKCEDTAQKVVSTIISALNSQNQLTSPNLFYYEDKLVVGSFKAESKTGSWWAGLKEEYRDAGLDPFAVLLYNGIGHKGNAPDHSPVVDVWSDWGARFYTDAVRDYQAAFPKNPDQLIMAAIIPQDNRYRTGFQRGAEARGSMTLRNNWMSAIQSETDWAQLITWNDHGEHASFIPNTATQFAVFDISAYYITWFKTGVQPEIKRDCLYYFHRIYKGPPWLEKFKDSGPDWVNEIELLAFLSAPGTLEIITEEGISSENVPAGIQSIRAPLPDKGIPQFRLLRDQEVIIDFNSMHEIGKSAGGGYSELDLIYRCGGSLRAARGNTLDGTRGNPDDYLSPEQGEPVWLVQ